MKSVMLHSFANVPEVKKPRSSFNLSRGYKTTFDAGYLVPFFWNEVLPGDTFNVRTNTFARLATPIFPVMDNMFLDVFYFFIPNRLTWDHWEEFNGQQRDPGDSTDFLCPQVPAPVGGWNPGTLYNYFGMRPGVSNYSINNFYGRAYNLVWNDWFRDENLQDSVVVDRDDGPDTNTDYVLLRRGKRFDYFTAALPWPQKGPAVEIPLGTSAPIIPSSPYPVDPAKIRRADTGAFGSTGDLATNNTTGNLLPSGGADPYFLDPNGSLVADLSTASAATINALRQASSIERVYEQDARGGTRYPEIIRGHFGVISPDARLQRPELLATNSVRVNVNPIAQTSSTDATTPQGNLAAMGTASHNGVGFTKSFTEHGVIIGLISARADLNYQQGLPREWSRQTRWDFYWPLLSQIGEQAILNKEIYLQGTSADDEVFGYIPRYDEYRFAISLITGLFNSDATTSLDAWHLAQDFGSLPTLNSTFIQDDPPFDRIIAVETEPHFLLDCYHHVTAARVMPVNGIPGIARF